MGSRALRAAAVASLLTWIAAAGGCLSSDDNASPSTPDAGAYDGEGVPLGDGASPGQDGSGFDGSAIGDAQDSDGAVDLGPAAGTLYGAASADGSAMLVMITDGTAPRWSHYEVGQGWSPVAALPGAATVNISPGGQALAIDATGNAFFVWVGSEGGKNGLDVARYDHATHAWGAIAKPDTSGQALSTFLALSVNAGGEALVLIARSGAGVPHDMIAHHYAAGAWTPETVLAQPSTTIGTPISVRIQDNGVGTALWMTGAGQVIATRAATTWTAGPSLGAVPANAQSDIAIDGAGDVLFGFQAIGTPPQVYQYDAAGAAWAGPTKLGGEANDGIACNLTVAVAPNGDGVVTRCFTGYPAASNPMVIESYAYTKSTKLWGTATPIASAGFGRNFAFSYDAAANGLAVWAERPDRNTPAGPAVTSRYTLGKGWSPLSPALGSAQGGPTTALLAPDGHGWIAWVEGQDVMVERASP